MNKDCGYDPDNNCVCCGDYDCYHTEDERKEYFIQQKKYNERESKIQELSRTNPRLKKIDKKLEMHFIKLVNNRDKIFSLKKAEENEYELNRAFLNIQKDYLQKIQDQLIDYLKEKKNMNDIDIEKYIYSKEKKIKTDFDKSELATFEFYNSKSEELEKEKKSLEEENLSMKNKRDSIIQKLLNE